MSIKKRVKAIFVDPRKKLASLLPELWQLRQDLTHAIDARDSLTEIVHFFDAVSRWHDRGIGDLIAAFEEVNYGQYDEVLEKLRTLQKHIVNAGRNEFGWNRTKPGQTVTEADVFLGNIYGLFTHPVPFWKQRKDDPKDEWEGTVWGNSLKGLNAYDVVSRQAQGFMNSHALPMIPIIKYLVTLAEPVAA